MEKVKGKQASLFMWAIVAALLAHNLVIPVMSSAIFEDQKNFFYFPPHDPHVGGTPPTGSSPSPPTGSGGSHGSTPSHGTPSHGGGHYGGTPPANCGTPPSGGHHNPTPAPPRRSGGGGYYHTPPSTPSTPSTPTNPRTPSTPSTPNTPSTPTTPSPPFDPNSPFTGTCNFWRTHPGFIWGLFGWWGTVGGAFGVTSGAHSFGSHMSLLDALSNTRPDGVGALYREGTASLLNSMVSKRFPYTTKHVRDSFVAALGSNKAAAAQAQLFKLANEGKLTPSRDSVILISRLSLVTSMVVYPAAFTP